LRIWQDSTQDVTAGWRGDDGDEGAGDEDDDDDNPDEVDSMAMTMATISPLREEISSADFCLPESFLSVCVFCPAEAAESISDPPES
jgi:hypothetical protein